jgi:hypothetical protein
VQDGLLGMGIREGSEYAFFGPYSGEDVVTKLAMAFALAVILPNVANSPAAALTQLDRDQAALASERQTCVEAATTGKKGRPGKLSALDYAEMHRAVSACSTVYRDKSFVLQLDPKCVEAFKVQHRDELANATPRETDAAYLQACRNK